mmetsp:Transcript_9896/g.10979  ORF Transcript_9896/g.10979 Transcript_9896/m.10979 type:complete len:222 (-) Transcript_9896:156-821(-)
MSKRNAVNFAVTNINRLRNGNTTSTNGMSFMISSTAKNKQQQQQVITPCLSHFFSTASSSSYKSPYSDFFAMMQKNQTSLSSTGTSTSSSKTPATTTTSSSPPEIPTLKCGIPETNLKFKTTNYSRLMAPPYIQTSEYKVTLQVKIKYLPLHTPLEIEIFQQIVGTRYDVEKNELKLTSNQFASRIENKRHLCSMLDRIVIGAKRLASEIDGQSQQTQQSS